MKLVSNLPRNFDQWYYFSSFCIFKIILYGDRKGHSVYPYIYHNKITREDEIQNETIRNELKLVPLEEKVLKYKNKLKEYIRRMEDSYRPLHNGYVFNSFLNTTKPSIL